MNLIYTILVNHTTSSPFHRAPISSSPYTTHSLISTLLPKEDIPTVLPWSAPSKVVVEDIISLASQFVQKHQLNTIFLYSGQGYIHVANLLHRYMQKMLRIKLFMVTCLVNFRLQATARCMSLVNCRGLRLARHEFSELFSEL